MITTEKIDNVERIFNLHSRYFPHLRGVREEIIDRMVKDTLMMKNGVLITYSKVNRFRKLSKNSNMILKPDDVIIHQLATDYSVKGGTKSVMKEFEEKMKSEGMKRLVGSVRKSNVKCNGFGYQNGWKIQTEISWANGYVKGWVYTKKLQSC
jgi:hypothetical protein